MNRFYKVLFDIKPRKETKGGNINPSPNKNSFIHPQRIVFGIRFMKSLKKVAGCRFSSSTQTFDASSDSS